MISKFKEIGELECCQEENGNRLQKNLWSHCCYDWQKFKFLNKCLNCVTQDVHLLIYNTESSTILFKIGTHKIYIMQ